jgi:hypothetical protein
MKKYIVLSVNDNVDYLYYTPLVCWAWEKLGWTPLVMFHGNTNINPTHNLLQLIISTGKVFSSDFNWIENIDGYRSDTITQVSRLYASQLVEQDSYLMTGDIDMIPLSDYWKPNLNNVTVYGHDLTGFGHFPICYIGMPKATWDFVMSLEPTVSIHDKMKRDLDSLPQAKDPDFYKYWFTDQDLITENLKRYGTGKIDFVNRGQYSNGFAKGRVDRGSWTLEHEHFIDAHLFQQTHHSEEKIRKTFDLLEKVWPNEDFQWFRDYTVKFKELAK